MKPPSLLSLTFGVAAFCCVLSSSAHAQVLAHAQVDDDSTTEARAATRQVLEGEMAKLDTALLRGDAAGVLALLAPDFELGDLEYRKRNYAWMSQFLPRQLERAWYTQLKATIVGVRLKGNEAVMMGYLESKVALKAKAGTTMSGMYVAIWNKTEDGWRLKKGDDLFYPLSQIPLPPAALTVAPLSNTPAANLALQNPSVVLTLPHWKEVTPLAFSPDGSVLATYDGYDGLHFSSAVTGAFLRMMKVPESVNSMTYAPDGTLVTGHSDGMVRLWDVKRGLLKHTWSVSEWGVDAVCVSPDGRTLAVVGADQAYLWDIVTGRKTQTLKPTLGNIEALFFSPDSRLVICSTSSVGKRSELWSVKEGKRVQVVDSGAWGRFLPGRRTFTTFSSTKLRFHTLGQQAITREVAIPDPWGRSISPRIAAPDSVPPIDGPPYFPSVIIAPDGKTAASIYVDGSIGLWDVETGNIKRLLRGFPNDPTGGNYLGGGVTSLGFSADSTLLAAGSRRGETALWNVPSP